MNVDVPRASPGTWLTLLAAALAIYLPDVGHGFVQDDFAWILHARSNGIVDALERAFTTSIGFYRPLVTLSFALNEWMFGLQPFGYGLTNLALALASMWAVERLARQLRLAPAYALLAAAIWMFNFHGINMGVLWLSGRSSLLSTLFAVLAACMLEARRPIVTAAFVFLAMLSKEDAVLLPFILTAWRLIDARFGTPRDGVLRDCWGLFAPLAVYAVLRFQSGAFTPATAPDFYRFTIDAGLLARNFVEYVQRSVSTGALILIALMVTTRMSPRLVGVDESRTIFIKTLIWWVGGFALTIWLPVRSNLYALLPSVGVAIAVGTLAGSLVPPLPLARRRLLVAIGLLLPFLLLPIYRSRNVRWVSLADLTSATLTYVGARAPELPDRTIVALIDDEHVRANFINAFSGLTPDASQLFLPRGIELAINSPPDASRPRVEVRLADVMYTP